MKKKGVQKSSSRVKPKEAQHSFSSDEPNVEVAELEEVHANISAYVLNPKLKASAIYMMQTTE